MIETARLRLRSWNEADREAFAALHAAPAVMQDYGGPIARAESDAKLVRYMATFARTGFCRWAIETRQGAFLGYAGLMPSAADQPLGAHVDIGWRLRRAAWDRGYATEAAAAALRDAFARIGLHEVLAYTAPDNARSQAMMTRLCLWRDPARDFTITYDGIGQWRGPVWRARLESVC